MDASSVRPKSRRPKPTDGHVFARTRRPCYGRLSPMPDANVQKTLYTTI